MPLTRSAVLVVLLMVSAAMAQTPLLRNGGFEVAHPATLAADGLLNHWKLADPPLVPDAWTLNDHYHGTLAVVTGDAQEGKQFVRITAPADDAAHLYQMIDGLKVGQWYRVGLWARGGPLDVCFYQYFNGHPMNAPGVASVRKGSSVWRHYVTYYQPQGEGFAQAALALSTSGGQTVDLDDVTIEPLSLPAPAANAPDITFSNEALTWTIAPSGVLKSFRCKASGKEYVAEKTQAPIISLRRDGVEIPVYSVSQEGDRLNFQFIEPQVKVTLRVVSRPTHFLLEVVSAEPADVEELTVSFAVKRLADLAWAFGATYDKDFGACLFCASVNAHNSMQYGADSVGLSGQCEAAHKLVGAKWVLIGTPYAQMKSAVMAAEQASGLPCPMKDGKSIRDSASNHKSYLFATSVNDEQIDTLIKYAKVGGFGQIIFLKDCWLANHGHYDINRTNFKDGLASVQRAVSKIHAAGLEAGVHVFGPSISPNDPWITPLPDQRLAFKALPPLAESIDAKATTLTLTAAPDVDLVKTRYQGFPGYAVRLGDEIITYGAVEAGAPYRLVRCQRGAFGTRAVAHAVGAPVKHLLAMWDYFLVDPDSTLADELTSNFANVVNAADFDFCYFDASDGIMDQYFDRWYYLNKLHLGYYSKFRKPMLYQTSNGTGSDLVWHFVPRSASADGHGDLKGYLDERWPGILQMGKNWTSADIGWYYWFQDVRPDQMEYICARVLGVDGNISMETSVEATDRLAQSRQVYEMIGRWEHARAERAFGPEVRAKLLEPKRDFKLFGASRNWKLSRAAYEEPRIVDALDGTQNVWTINNDTNKPATLGFELVRQGQAIVAGDYDDPQAVVIEDFSEVAPYQASARNDYEKFVIGDPKQVTPGGAVREGVTQTFSQAPGRTGGSSLLMHAQNTSEALGWTGLGRRFEQPRDLSGYQALGVWIYGDGKEELVRLQLRDSAGHSADWLPRISYQGWKLHFFPLPTTGFDWSRVEYALFYFNNMLPGSTTEVRIGPLKLLPKLSPPPEQGQPVLEVNGQRVPLPVSLKLGQALTHEGMGEVKLWPGGMALAQPVKVATQTLQLKPGANEVKVLWSDPAQFPGNLQVLLYRVWPLEK